MLHIILGILKVILLIILAILGFILVVVLLCLLFPFSYRIKVEADKEIKGKASIGWLFYIFYFSIKYENKEFISKFRLFGIPLSFNRKSKKEEIKNLKEDITKVEIAADKAEVEDESLSADTHQVEAQSISDNSEDQNEDLIDNSDEQNEIEILMDNTDKDKMILQSNTEDIRGKSIFSGFKKKKNKQKKIKKSSGTTNVLEKLNKIRENIKKISAELKDEGNRAALRKIKKEAIRIIKHIRPRKCKVDIEYGTDNPALTGQILGIIGMFYPVFKDNLKVRADFEKVVFRGSVYLRGRMVMAVIVISAIRLLLNKDIKNIIKKIKK